MEKTTLPATPLQQVAYEIIKKRIITLEYAPGELLNTVDLQDGLGVSRTPIREALGRLEQENLVHSYPKKGFAVSGVNLATITTVYEARLLIEPFIVQHYGSLADKKALTVMHGHFLEGMTATEHDVQLHMDYDDTFHALLRAACPNIYLSQVLDNIEAQAQRVRIISGYFGLKLQKLCREHVELTEAIIDDQLDRAASLMTAHLINARKNAFLAPALTGNT